ncbi:MAG TPA: hypothetical protein VJR89_15455 [Polyangiales bacterium]|nr:hypothetical protein [Polyangiales bacterium]
MQAREFRLPPLDPGYKRYEPPPIDVDVGESADWAQWVGGPLDQDYDVIDIKGEQSVGGHHALVYATVDEQPVGFTRFWKDEDQLASRLMGGIGGEGGANVNLPPGVVFRVKKGSYLLIQTHYLNALERKIVGRTYVDVKLEPVDPSRTVASMMSSTTLAIDLPAREKTVLDVYCSVQRDLRFIQVSNHMHDYGTTSVTDWIDPQGVKHVLKEDKTWSGDLALNPNFTKFPADTPQLVPKGSMLHTQCIWQNTTDGRVKFPAEMCVFFGFIYSESDVYCTDNKWSEASSQTQTVGPSTGNAPTGMATGGCTSEADQKLMKAAEFDQQSTDCAIPCALDPDVTSCTTPCFEKVGLSPACAVCNAANIGCGSKQCLSECLLDSKGAPCRDCVMAKCDPAFRMCTGT